PSTRAPPKPRTRSFSCSHLLVVSLLQHIDPRAVGAARAETVKLLLACEIGLQEGLPGAGRLFRPRRSIPPITPRARGRRYDDSLRARNGDRRWPAAGPGTVSGHVRDPIEPDGLCPPRESTS